MQKLTVSPTQLIFPKHGITTLAIKVNSTRFKFTANLPAHFTVVHLTDAQKGTTTITITYNGLTNLDDAGLHYIVIEDYDNPAAAALRVGVLVEDKRNEQQRDNALQCKICFLQYTEEGPQTPMILNECGHTICHACTEQFKGKSRTTDKNYVSCPFDRVASQSCHKNYTVVEMVQETAQKEAQQAETEHCVDPILPCYENPNHEATHYCKTCSVEYCQSCLSLTHATRIFRSHDFILISQREIEMPMCSCMKIRAQFMCMKERCPKHQEALCHYCFDKQHRKCPKGEILTIAKQNETKLKSMQSELLEKKKRLNDGRPRKQSKYIQKLRQDLESGTFNVALEYQSMMDKIAMGYKQFPEYRRNFCSIERFLKEIQKVLLRKEELHKCQKLIREVDGFLERNVRNNGKFDKPNDPAVVERWSPELKKKKEDDVEESEDESEEDSEEESDDDSRSNSPSPPPPPPKRPWLSTNPRAPGTFKCAFY